MNGEGVAHGYVTVLHVDGEMFPNGTCLFFMRFADEHAVERLKKKLQSWDGFDWKEPPKDPKAPYDGWPGIRRQVHWEPPRGGHLRT